MLTWMNRSIDLMIFSLDFGDNGDDVEETVIVAVGASQPGVAPYLHEPAKKYLQSKPVSGGGIGRCHWQCCSPSRPTSTAFRQHRMFCYYTSYYNVKQLHKTGTGI